MQTAVDKFLLNYHNAPLLTVGEAPAVLLKGHLLHTGVTALSLVGDKLWVRQHQLQQPKWRPATVVGVEGNRVINVQLPDGATQCCHAENTKLGCEIEQWQVNTAGALQGTEINVRIEPASEYGAGPSPQESTERPRRNVKPPERLGMVAYL